MKKGDIEFLRSLQSELKTQNTDSQASPCYWGIMEHKLVRVPEGCGEPYVVNGDGGVTSLDDFITEINEQLYERFTD